MLMEPDFAAQYAQAREMAADSHADDIINTVAIEPTLASVIVLAAIVLIRTFLSLSLQVEIEGRWPWQARFEKDLQAVIPGQLTQSCETTRKPDSRERLP